MRKAERKLPDRRNLEGKEERVKGRTCADIRA
jgi:hypothetical protein